MRLQARVLDMSEYTIKEMSKEDFMDHYEIHRMNMFSRDHSCSVGVAYSESEREKLKNLRIDTKSHFFLYLGIFKAEEFVGWSWGFQQSDESFYMCNSAILPKYRRLGLYSRVIEKSVDILKEEGFQIITSRHTATNNAVLIPKLKAGFIIQKMELDDRFGVLIHLSYFTNKTRRKIMDYRSGQLAPDEEIKKFFKGQI
jgi:ribosomal protein S18 acetylase RimI-like enzyme